MRTKRQFVVIAAMLLVGAVALGTLGAPTRVQEALVPPATVPALQPDAACTGDCAAFVDALRTPLQALVAEGGALAELGQARSRNVLELTIRMDRFRDAASQVRGVISGTSVPPAFQADVRALSDWIVQAESAIDDSLAAIRGFDWDDLGRSVDAFAGAVDQLKLISARLSI
jgi:hypothetical protein